MKTRVSKTPAVQAKKKDAFFGKEGKGGAFGAEGAKENFFGGAQAGGGSGSAGAVQCKLTVGQPNDVYEKEADATADKVVQRLAQPGKENAPVTPASGLLQKKPIFESEGEPKDEPLQRKGEGSGVPGVAPSVESGIQSSKGGGSPLPAATRKQMESGLGADLSGVRVHNDSGARKMSKDLNAQAFTHGKDIYFNSGKYDTNSTAGKHLLAHELTHVVQQNKGLSRKPDISRKESGAPESAAGSGLTAAETDHATLRRVPMVQKNDTPGGGTGGTGGSGDPNNAGGDDKDITKMDQTAISALGKPKEGWITKTKDKENKDVIGIHFDNLPFKQYAGNFVTKDNEGNEYLAKPPYRKPTKKRSTRQGPVWKKEAIEHVKATLGGIVKDKELKGSEFNLTVRKKKKLGVSGTVEQIANQIVVPFWDDKGKEMKHQVEHKIDWQVGGFDHNVDVISNLLLLEASENMRIGQVVLGNMEKFYKAIIKYYKDQKVTGLADSFEDGKGLYAILTESINTEGVPVKGSMYTIDQMKKGADNNPVDEKLIELTDNTTIPNTFYLRTSPIGAYNLIPYDFVNNKYIEIVKETDPNDPKKKILKSIILPPLEDSNKVIDQSVEKAKRTLTPEPVAGSPDHYTVLAGALTAHLKDSVREFKKLSPIEWSEVEFDPNSGWSAAGKINTGVSFLENVDISIKVENSVFTIEADIDVASLAKDKVPKPFRIDYSSLNLSASSNGAFAIGGGLGFSIENYGKGHIAGSVTNDGFGLTGGFEFEKKYFTGSLTVGYFKKGDKHDWSIEGDIALKKNIIKNLDKLAIHLSYKDHTLSGSATAFFSLPSIKSITVNASVDQAGNMTIGGSFELGKLPKVKGASGTITVSKKGGEWDLDLDGKVTPDISFDGLTVDEVNISYHKGIFDISSGAHFKKGKVIGNFTLGLTNKPVSNDGKKSEGEGGKELKFYADGTINVDIVDGVGGTVHVKVTPDGDVLLDGQVGLTEDKQLFSMPPLDENLFKLEKNLPLASCGIVTLSLHFGGRVDIYAHLNPLTFDKGSYVGLTGVSLKNFSQAHITSHLSVSSHLDAGIKLGLELGLDASLLGILHATVEGTGDLDFRALDAGLTVTFGAEWSAQQGARLTEGQMKVHLSSKLIATLGATIKVYADLLVTDITIWSHHWKLAQKEWEIFLFGSGDLIIPLPIGNDGSINMSQKDMRGQLGKLENSVDNEKMAARSRDFMDGKGTTDEDRRAQRNEVVKKEVLARFTDPARFEFNKSVNYLQSRYELVDYLREAANEDKTIDLSYVDGEIKRCEFEEYDKFGPYIQNETFTADIKYQLIDEFMTNHPTLDEGARVNLRSMVVPDKKDNKDSKVQKKETGAEPVIQTKAETDSKGDYTGNYIFDPGHDGLDAGFFNKVKKDVLAGLLDDTEIKALRADSIQRNGTVEHAELLLMAAMRNPVNVTRMKAHTRGPLTIPMSDIKQADKDYLTNFGVEKNPLDASAYFVRGLAAVLGLSKEKLSDVIDEYDNKAMELVHKYAGKQFSDQADALIVFCQDNPLLSWDNVISAMLNGASDGTEGDRIMAGTVYAIAKNAGHVMAPKILSGELKIDALVPSVFHRIAGDAEALYQYSTDGDVLKSDTLYIQTDLNIFQLRSQALVIHELTHAADDFAAGGSSSKQEDSLKLETHAYKEQGKYMMDQILALPAGTGPGFLIAAAQYVHDSPLYYWSMVAAAKDDATKYESTLVSIGTHAPMSMTAAAVKADLALSAADLDTKVRAALVAYRTPKGKQLYSPGTTTIGGPGGHYFVQRSPEPGAAASTTAPDSTFIQRDDNDDKQPVEKQVLNEKFTIGGDPFRIKMIWREKPEKRVFLHISYAGSGQVDGGELADNNSIDVAPHTATPVAIPGKPNELKIDLFNDGSYIITVEDPVTEDAKWYPALKTHYLHIDYNGVHNKYGERYEEVRVKAANAIPVTMKEKVSSIGVPKDDNPIYNPVAALMTARYRIQALKDEKPNDNRWNLLITQLNNDIDYLQKNAGKLSAAEELKWSTKANAFDSASREFIAIIDQMDRYGKKESYPEDIAGEAIRIVEATKGQFTAAIYTAYSEDIFNADISRQQAQLAFAALPYKISALYLKKGAALEAQINNYKKLRDQLDQFRGMNGRGAILCNADLYFASGALQFKLQNMIESMRKDLFDKAEGELTGIMNVAMSVQVYKNVLALMTIYEQFIYFDREIPWLTSSKTTRQDITIYKNKFAGYFNRINTVLIPGDPIDEETFSSVLKSAISDFAADVNKKEFKTLLDNINDDFQEYAEVKAVVKGVFVMLVVVAAASATGGVAGAVMGGFMEGLGAEGTALAFGLTTLAEAAAFTSTSRELGDIMGMKSDTPYVQDLLTNWLMFAYMKKAAQLYEGVTAALKTSGRLKAFNIAQSTAAKLTFSIAALQAFSVAQMIGKGKLSGAEFGKSLFFNTILTSVLHFGRFATEPLEKKVAGSVRDYVVKNFAGELGALETEREALKVMLSALNAEKTTAPDKLPEALERTKALAEREMALINRAAKAKGLTGEALTNLTKTYIQKIDEANLRLAQLGVDANPGVRPIFREVKPGIIAYEDSKAGEAEKTLKDFYKENEGDVKKTDFGFVGKMGAERVIYVPESSQAAKTGLIASAGSRTAKPADALEYIKLRLSPKAKRGLEILNIEHRGDEKVLGILKGMEDAGKDIDKALRDYISDDEIDQMSREQLKQRIADTGDEAALKRYEAKSNRTPDDAKFKDNLKSMKANRRSLIDRLHDEQVAEEKKAQKEADFKQLADDTLTVLKQKGFFKDAKVLGHIEGGAKYKFDLRSDITEFLAKEQAVQEQLARGKQPGEIESMSNLDVVKKVPGYDTIDAWKKANPDKLDAKELKKAVGKLRTGDGQLWRSMSEIDYLILQKAAAGKALPSIVESGQVKSGTEEHKDPNQQHSETGAAIDQMLAGDKSIQVFQQTAKTGVLGDNVSNKIDFHSLKTSDKVNVAPTEKPGDYGRRLPLRIEDLNQMADEIQKNPDKYTK